MGRIYIKQTIGDKTIGYFSNGSVTRGQGIMSDTSTVVKYSNGHVYGNWMGSLLSNQVAYCNEHGEIYAGNGGGSVLAKLENGIVYDGWGYGKKEIARYEGDMYGAAAAVASLILGLSSAQKNNPSKPPEPEPQSSEDLNLLQTIIAILVFLPMLVITIIKYIFKAITFLIKLLTKPLFTIILIPTYWVVYVIWEILYAMNVPSEYDYSIKKVFTDIHIIVYMIISILSLIAAIILYKKTKEKTLNNHLVGGISFLQNAPWLANTFFNTCFFFNYVIHICGIYNNPERKNPLFIDILRIIRHYYYPDNISAPKHILYSIGSGVHGMNTLINDLTFSFFVGYEEFFFIAIAVLLSFIYLLISRNKLKKKASIQTTETT